VSDVKGFLKSLDSCLALLDINPYKEMSPDELVPADRVNMILEANTIQLTACKTIIETLNLKIQLLEHSLDVERSTRGV
jgi:hypothetical protein